MYYIGVDLGTSAVKLILMAEDGSLRNIQSCEYPLFFPENGWSEQNPADWWNAVVKGIHKLCFDISPDQVAGISFGGQMHGLVALDASDQVIRPAILWNDGRTEEETRYLNEEIAQTSWLNIPAILRLPALPLPSFSGCRNTSRNFLPGSGRSCCQRITCATA